MFDKNSLGKVLTFKYKVLALRILHHTFNYLAKGNKTNMTLTKSGEEKPINHSVWFIIVFNSEHFFHFLPFDHNAFFNICKDAIYEHICLHAAKKELNIIA